MSLLCCPAASILVGLTSVESYVEVYQSHPREEVSMRRRWVYPISVRQGAFLMPESEVDLLLVLPMFWLMSEQ
jgi:hypothetical protein